MGELHRATKIATDFNLETKRNISKYVSAGFSSKIVNDVTKTFKEEKEVPIIQQWLFEERNTVTFSENNEKFVKSFIKKLSDFTNNKG